MSWRGKALVAVAFVLWVALSWWGYFDTQKLEEAARATSPCPPIPTPSHAERKARDAARTLEP